MNYHQMIMNVNLYDNVCFVSFEEEKVAEEISYGKVEEIVQAKGKTEMYTTTDTSSNTSMGSPTYKEMKAMLRIQEDCLLNIQDFRNRLDKSEKK